MGRWRRLGHPRPSRSARPSLGPVFRVAYGGANWLMAPLVLAILFVGLAGPLGAPWLVPLSAVPFFAFTSLYWFFRDPERAVAPDIACPADGRVVRLDTVDDPDLGRCDRLSVFMRVHDVHVNRIPVDGDVRRVEHRPGKHVPAFNKDSDRNERVETHLRTAHGDVKVIQIAGAVARRIVPYTAPGDHVHKGERLGLIRLGSRCDLLVPQGRVDWKVKLHDRVWANRTNVGAWK